MDIKFYTTKTPKNYLMKVLSNEMTLSISFKDKVNIINPVLIIKSDTFLNYNYVYMEDLKRYYFIDSITFINKNTYELNLSLDVLMSYKDDILKSKGYILMSKNNNYLNNVESQVKKEVDIIESDVELPFGDGSLIMVTLGG